MGWQMRPSPRQWGNQRSICMTVTSMSQSQSFLSTAAKPNALQYVFCYQMYVYANLAFPIAAASESPAVRFISFHFFQKLRVQGKYGYQNIKFFPYFPIVWLITLIFMAKSKKGALFCPQLISVILSSSTNINNPCCCYEKKQQKNCYQLNSMLKLSTMCPIISVTMTLNKILV